MYELRKTFFVALSFVVVVLLALAFWYGVIQIFAAPMPSSEPSGFHLTATYGAEMFDVQLTAIATKYLP